MSAPLSSMTGFARTDGLVGGTGWAWELRSVNGRGFDLRLRLPGGFDALEPSLREIAGRTLRRGSVTGTLLVRRGESGGVAVDRALLDRLLHLAIELAGRIPDAPPPRAEGLLALPGVLRVASVAAEQPQPAELDAAREGFSRAVDLLAAARRAEGARLAAILTGQLGEVAALRQQAHHEAAEQPAQQRARMLDALQALLRDAPALSDERIAQEVALLAARADVREELDRIESHVAAAHALLAEGAHIGRRFDFLVQEFGRETNTLCSKSASAALTATGLRLKATIEQLREQVQNVE